MMEKSIYQLLNGLFHLERVPQWKKITVANIILKIIFNNVKWGLFLGRRVCLGESLARATLFTYFATLLQSYRFEKDGHDTSNKPVELGFTLTPAPYNPKVSKR
jgi:cytochrome P450